MRTTCRTAGLSGQANEEANGGAQKWRVLSPEVKGYLATQIQIGIEIDGGGCPTRVGCSWAFAFSCASSLRRKATNDRLHGGALIDLAVAVASWSAAVLSRFLGGCPDVLGGPLLLGIGAPTRKAPEDWSTPRRYRARGGLIRGGGQMRTTCRTAGRSGHANEEAKVGRREGSGDGGAGPESGIDSRLYVDTVYT